MTAPSRKVVAWVWLIFFLGLILGSVIWVSALVAEIAKKRAAAPQVLGRVSDFELVDQDGKNVSLADLRGKIWVADFIFTRCAGPCPLMSSRMAELQKSLDGVEGVGFVSISVDPDYDRPELLREYGKRYGAKPGTWIFLTGDKKRIFEMISKDFKMGVADGSGDQPIIHGTHFVLVDGEGRIRGYYGINDPNLESQAVAEIERAVKTKTSREDALEKIIADIGALKHASQP